MTAGALLLSALVSVLLCTKMLTLFSFAGFRQRKDEHSKNDMASFFIEEHEKLGGERSLKERDLLLSGTSVSAVVAGR